MHTQFNPAELDVVKSIEATKKDVIVFERAVRHMPVEDTGVEPLLNLHIYDSDGACVVCGQSNARGSCKGRPVIVRKKPRKATLVVTKKQITRVAKRKVQCLPYVEPVNTSDMRVGIGSKYMTEEMAALLSDAARHEPEFVSIYRPHNILGWTHADAYDNAEAGCLDPLDVMEQLEEAIGGTLAFCTYATERNLADEMHDVSVHPFAGPLQK